MAEKKPQSGIAHRTGQAAADVIGRIPGEFARTLLGAVGSVAPVVQALPAIIPSGQSIRRFGEGLRGEAEGSTDAVRAAPKRAAAAAASKPAAAPKAPETITPQARQLAYLDNILKQPLTLRQLSMATGMMPAPTKPRSAEDVILSQTAGISDQLFQADLTAATKAFQQGTPDYDTAVQSAVKNYYERNAALSGIDLQKAALAELVSKAEED